ncbi:FadR/GntR family transcriptional regulator [Actinophytocola sp.]|uniref:FadR/GntR family transcriptional regulator n=1 Tax=Actinophytocola sp. TaxID=1872138 RepID=UPI002ED04331
MSGAWVNGGYAGRGLHGQVVNELGSRIVAGRLKPGESIDLVALEAEFDISRTVLREALKVLAAKGLVDARQKRGTFVRPRTDWQLLDVDVLRWRLASQSTGELLNQLAEVRSFVEPAGARLAALRRDDDDLAALTAALDAMAAADPASPEAVEADLRFHRQLLAASHNELLVSMAAMIEVALAARDSLVHAGNVVRDALPAHRAVVETISAGDPEAAELAMRALLAQAVEDVESVR